MPKVRPFNPEHLSPTQVAEICRVSRRLVQHWFDAGRLTGYKIPSLRGRVTRRIKADSLRAFMVESELPVEWFDDYLADLNSQLPPSKGE